MIQHSGTLLRPTSLGAFRPVLSNLVNLGTYSSAVSASNRMLMFPGYYQLLPMNPSSLQAFVEYGFTTHTLRVWSRDRYSTLISVSPLPDRGLPDYRFRPVRS